MKKIYGIISAIAVLGLFTASAPAQTGNGVAVAFANPSKSNACLCFTHAVGRPGGGLALYQDGQGYMISYGELLEGNYTEDEFTFYQDKLSPQGSCTSGSSCNASGNGPGKLIGNLKIKISPDGSTALVESAQSTDKNLFISAKPGDTVGNINVKYTAPAPAR